MKIAGRAGHNPLCEGASALLNEVVEDRKIFAASKKYLSTRHSFIDCTPENKPTQSQDLNYGTDMANKSYADMFYSIHLNKAYDKYVGRLGAEIWLYNENSKLRDEAERILKNLEALGFKNRGIKYKTGLHDLSASNMPAMIVECFFLEATEDVALYQRIGPEILGLAIANGIDNNIEFKAEREVQEVVELPVNFNEKYYLFANPDVAIVGLGAKEHYLQYGWKEGRACYPTIPLSFDAEQYLTNYPDVAKNGMGAEKHYLEYGVYEGRGWRAYNNSVR